MKYAILHSTTVEGLEDKVQKALDNGWKLQGGVTLMASPETDYTKSSQLVCQAVVKHEG